MPAFMDSLDIANRALDHLGLEHINDVNENSTRNEKMAASYDKLREAELERNGWVFAKRKVILRPVSPSSRLLAPDLWNVNETYLPGSIVSDANGDLWISWQDHNYGNEPGVSPVWDSYYGPMAIDAYDPTVVYYAGEIVYQPITSPKGTFAIYFSQQNMNSDVPNTATVYDPTVTYGLDDRVTYAGSMWRSLITLNLNITPADPPANYSAGRAYNAGDKTVGSDGLIYTATTNGTQNIDPVTDDGTFWTKGDAAGWKEVPLPFIASGKWVPLFSNMTNMPTDNLMAPLNNPTANTSKHSFRMPAQALRKQRIGYRSHTYPDDVEPHGDYLTSADAILLHEFVANIRDVRKMHPMFCEGLAIRMAAANCKSLTGIDPAQTSLNAEYDKFMKEARIVNGIEEGPEEPDEDEWITVRTGGPGGFTSGATNWWN